MNVIIAQDSLLFSEYQNRPLRRPDLEAAVGLDNQVREVVARVVPTAILGRLRVEDLLPGIAGAADVDAVNRLIPLVVAKVHDGQYYIPGIVPGFSHRWRRWPTAQPFGRACRAA